VEALAGGARPEDGQADGDGKGGGAGGGDRDETAPRRRAARSSLRLDARPQARRRLDLGRGIPRERDRVLLLGKSLAELRRRLDPRLERCPALRRERSVGERRQLGFVRRGW
jgi:hypothetical protein